MRRSLRSLVKQGYTLEDIGAMFGVSRERVRQWLRAMQIPRRSDVTLGSTRVWDDERRCFVPVTWRMAYRRRRRLCACGCGGLTRTRFCHGHACRGRVPSQAHRRKLRAAALARWARATPAEREAHGRRVAEGWARRS
jgi:hypothetical protein